MYDIIVVGAGPSGASSALFLARKGISVLIIEKKKLPRYKVCAGGTSKFTFDILDVSPTFFDALSIERLKIIYKNKEKGYEIPPNTIFTFHRGDFDYKLTILACENGAELVDGEEVISIEEENKSIILTTDLGHRFKTRYLIGADGVGSKVARFIGSDFNYKLPLAIQKDIPYENPVPTISLFIGLVPMGYGWIFPKKRFLSIGLGAYKFSLREMPKILSNILVGFNHDNLPLLAHPIPFYRGKRRLAKNNILLVGDSAHITDPFSGEGIRNGIKSARVAEEVIVDAMKKNKSLESYTEKLYTLLGRELFLSWIISGIFYKFQDKMFNLMDRFNMGFILSNLLNENISYSDLVKRIVRTIPSFLLQKLHL